jgi:ribosome-binding factor A
MARLRVKRVESLVREEAARFILQELNDPRLGFVTVTKVECTNDLSYARIFVSVLGSESQQRTTLRGLENAKPLLRARVGQALAIRRVPEVQFRLDEGVEKSIRMTELIRTARSSDIHPSDEEAGDEPVGTEKGEAADEAVEPRAEGEDRGTDDDEQAPQQEREPA